MKKIKVILVDDLAVVRTGYKILLKDITVEESQYNLFFINMFLIIDIPLRYAVSLLQKLFRPDPRIIQISGFVLIILSTLLIIELRFIFSD